jgi:hypothetical protein
MKMLGDLEERWIICLLVDPPLPKPEQCLVTHVLSINFQIFGDFSTFVETAREIMHLLSFSTDRVRISWGGS